MKNLFLNIHDQIRIHVRIKTPVFLGFLYYRHLYHLCQTFIEKSSVKESFNWVIQIGFPLKSGGRSFPRTNELFITKDYLYSHYQRKIIRGELEILNIDNPRVTVNLKVNFWGKLFFPIELFNSLIHFVAFQKGMCLLPGASIEKAGKGILLLGDEGSGKTNLVIASSKRGFGLIDDDFSFVHQGKILNYTPSVCLKFYHRKRFPSIPRNIKAKLLINEGISLLTNRYINLITPAPIDIFFAKRRSTSVALKKIYYLRRDGAFKMREIRMKKEMINSMILKLKICYPFLTRMCEVYSRVNSDSILARHWDQLEKKLKQELGEIPSVEIKSPSALTDTEIAEVFKDAIQS
jgi:hypothetical protein